MQVILTDELQNKTAELEQTRASAYSQVNKLVQDMDEKNRQIVYLEDRIKEISQSLPKDGQQELYEELGFELEEQIEDIYDEPTHKNKKKGLLGRFTALF